MNDVNHPPTRPGVGPPEYKAHGGTDCSQTQKGSAPLEPQGHDRLPARTARQARRPAPTAARARP